MHAEKTAALDFIIVRPIHIFQTVIRFGVVLFLLLRIVLLHEKYFVYCARARALPTPPGGLLLEKYTETLNTAVY